MKIHWLYPLLQVFDMPTSLRFYRDVLGFGVVQKSGDGDDVDWVWLRHDTCDLMLNTAYEREERPAAPDPSRVAAHSDTLLYLGCEHLEEVYLRLRAHGVKVSPPTIAPYGMKEVHATDPDGYELCFHWRETPKSNS